MENLMGKILKNSNQPNVQSVALNTFLKVEKGTKNFDVETFSTVDKGTKEFVMQQFETVNPVEKPKFEEPIDPPVEEPIVPEEPKDEVPADMIRLDKHDTLLKSAAEEAAEKANKEGYQKGFDEAKLQFEKAYMAEKQDYLGQLENRMKAAVNELTELRKSVESIDKDLPSIVLGFVKEIIGTERKLNDELVVSVIRNGLEKLKDMEDISFIVNPEDEHTVKTHVSGYALEVDPSIEVGGFTVKTRIGEVDFKIETLLENLEKSINEKLTTSEDS